LSHSRYALVLFALTLTLSGSLFAQSNSSKKQAPTQISADLGSCKVTFTVTDMLGKPIYDAKIKTDIHYGFLGKRSLSLEIGTNANGQARFIKMPDEVRDPLEFNVTHGSDSALVTWDPGTNCEAEYPVLLYRKKTEQTEQKQ
jgi:hypothetical protein